MRTLIGLAVLIVGLLVLGIWSKQDHAKNIENQLTSVASATVDSTTHPVSTKVSGRDIHVSGLADSEEEKQTIVSGLDSIIGNRVVVDDIKVLKKVTPYQFGGQKMESGLKFSGNIPTEAERASLDKLTGGTGSLELAAGIPDDLWLGFVMQSVNALSKTKTGDFEIKDRKLVLRGVVENPAGEAAVREALDELPNGYSADVNLKLLDDGLPAKVSFEYNAGTGGSVSGKAPEGLDISKLASALGISKLSGSLNESTHDGADVILESFKSIGEWLPSFDSLKLVAGVGNIDLSGELSKGSDLALISGALKEKLGGNAVIAVKAAATEGKNGTERVHAITGNSEVYSNGYWLAAMKFSPSVTSCKQSTSNIMGESNISFITGSANLGPRSLRVLNQLSSTLRHCLADTGLSVEIGGHTDSQGNDAANLELSQQRATAVLNALALRGINTQTMTAQGYGEQSPIADNNTKEGRAINRRTTFNWKQN